MVATGWGSVRAEVARRIQTRVWAPGDLIPTEEKLAREFGCARATVNRALRDLAAAGILERRRKAGTRVALNPVRKATLEIAVTRLEIEGRGQVYAFRLLEQTSTLPPVPVGVRLGLQPTDRLLHLRSLHFADGLPFLYEDRWLNTGVLPPAVVFDPVAISANEWLVRHMPYSYGDIAFSAANASALEAGLLGVAVGAALFITERTTWAGPLPITSVRLAHAPGYRLHTLV